MRILAFSDLHGDATTLNLLKSRLEGESFDCMLIAGDLTNADLVSPSEAIHQTLEIFGILETFKIPYYYVWGLPNRERRIASMLQVIEKPKDYTISAGSIENLRGDKKEEAFVFHLRNSEQNKMERGVFVPRKDLLPLKETYQFLASLKFGKLLKEEGFVNIGEYRLTSSPEAVAENTIFMKHHYRRIIQKALIQLDGHLHIGQRISNYLNLGFLYRDGVHGGQPMIGGYWTLILEGSKVSVEFANLGGKLKEFVCPNHPEQGTFYVPFYWKKCPTCYHPEEALINS